MDSWGVLQTLSKVLIGQYSILDNTEMDFPDGPVLRLHVSTSGGMGSIPGQGSF